MEAPARAGEATLLAQPGGLREPSFERKSFWTLCYEFPPPGALMGPGSLATPTIR